MSEKFITGIDIGSSSIKIAVGALDKNGIIQILVVAEEPSAGMNKGIITNLEEVVTSLSHALEKTERMISANVEHSIVGISGTHIISQISRGVVAVSNVKGEIREEDIDRVLEAARTVATPPNYEILHIVPLSFMVDSQPGIKDPRGMTGVRLEVETQVIEGLSNQIKNLSKCLSRTGLVCESLVFSILAAAEAVLDRRDKELGVAVLNLGSTTSSLAVFEEGDLLMTKILPIGARYISGDIAIGLKIPIDLAETVKIFHGQAIIEGINFEEKIDLSDLDEREKGLVDKKEVAEIIEARCEEIFKIVDKELSSIKKNRKLPGGLVITGGGAKLRGVVEMAKKIFKIPVSIGWPKNVNFMVEKANDPTFTTAIGLVQWGKELGSTTENSNTSFYKIIKNIFKKFLP